MTTSAITPTRQDADAPSREATPLPAPVCWLIWGLAAAFLWLVLLTPFFI